MSGNDAYMRCERGPAPDGGRDAAAEGARCGRIVLITPTCEGGGPRFRLPRICGYATSWYLARLVAIVHTTSEASAGKNA